MVSNLDGARSRIGAQNMQISSLEAQMAIYYGWNSRPSENPEHQKAIMNHREESRRYESDVEKSADTGEPAADEPAADEPTSDNATPVETRRQYRRKEDSYVNGTVPKKTGGQPGRKGVARKDKPEEV